MEQIPHTFQCKCDTENTVFFVFFCFFLQTGEIIFCGNQQNVVD